MLPIRYDEACAALASAKSIDDVKDIADRFEALREYARRAKNRTLELDAQELRVRSERRLGEMILDIRKEKTFKNGRPRLEELGLNPSLAAASQRLALIPCEDFEWSLRDWRKVAESKLNVPAPLRAVRNPNSHIAALKRQRRDRRIEADDPLDEFRLLSGRRIADILHGEIDRLEVQAERELEALRAIKLAMPVANPSPLESLLEIFGPDVIRELLKAVWLGKRIPQMPDVLSSMKLPAMDGRERSVVQ